MCCASSIQHAMLPAFMQQVIFDQRSFSASQQESLHLIMLHQPHTSAGSGVGYRALRVVGPALVSLFALRSCTCASSCLSIKPLL